MLVLPQLLEEAPPPDLPRIFVGNLTEQILDSSLHELLSRFGTVLNFARSKCRTFAHISLKADEESVAKCMSYLNNVKWFGTSLRVEKAKRHYLNRLRDEWKKQACEIPCSASKATNEEQKIASKLPFCNIPKGKHIRFSFPDEAFRRPLRSPPSQITSRLEEAIARPGRIESSAFASKQNSLQTTLSLFGLTSSQDEDQLKVTKRPLVDIHPSERYSKRPRSFPVQHMEKREPMQNACGNDVIHVRSTTSQDAFINSKSKPGFILGHDTTVDMSKSYSIELAEAIADDPSKIDVERERSSYLQVFRSMFFDESHQLRKSEKQNGSRGNMLRKNFFKRHRRAALYTLLQATDTDTCPLQITKNIRSNSKSEPTNDTRQGVTRDPLQGTTLITSYRQVALYKKLQLIQPTEAL